MIVNEGKQSMTNKTIETIWKSDIFRGKEIANREININSNIQGLRSKALQDLENMKEEEVDNILVER